MKRTKKEVEKTVKDCFRTINNNIGKYKDYPEWITIITNSAFKLQLKEEQIITMINWAIDSDTKIVQEHNPRSRKNSKNRQKMELEDPTLIF